MFKPNLRVTNKIINYLTDIAAARELILNASLLPQWEVKLRKEAIVKMAHHSTSIEGNPLTLEQVTNLKITTEAYQKMFNVSERTARNHLNELIKLDLIKPMGPQKGRYYVLV